VDTLVRLEQSSPHIQSDTVDIWKTLCLRGYPLAFSSDDTEEPESWRDRYFVLQDAEAKRLEEVGLRMRSQRLEAEEKKREREVKLTDRVPPEKRARGGWNINPQPKTLFQKTRSDTSRLQKNMYHSRMIPPMTQGRTYRVIQNTPSAKLPPPPHPNLPSCVKVNTVLLRRPIPATTTPGSSAPSTLKSLPASSAHLPSSVVNSKLLENSQPSAASRAPKLAPKSSPPSRNGILNSDTQHTSPPPSQDKPLKPLPVSKKDPMASLFMPKHRAHSQLKRS
jgi:elongin-A